MLFRPESIEKEKSKLLRSYSEDEVPSAEVFRKLLEWDPFDFVPLLQVGHSLENKGDLEAARRYYERAIEACPESPDGYLALSGLLINEPEHEDFATGLLEIGMWRTAWRLFLESPDPDRMLELSGGRHSAPPRFRERGSFTKFFKRALKTAADEPAEVTERLKPYRYIQPVLERGDFDMDTRELDDIVRLGEPMVPLLTGVVLQSFRGVYDDFDPWTTEAALTLLGEIGSASALSVTVEASASRDEVLSEIASWASHAIVKRHPELVPQLADLPEPREKFSAVEICCQERPDYVGEEADDPQATAAAPVQSPTLASPPAVGFEGLSFNRGFAYDDAPPVPLRPEERPGRNEPCWCGSGRKYKKCHLAEDENSNRAAREAEAMYGEEDYYEPEHDSHGVEGLGERLMRFTAERVSRKEFQKGMETFFGDTFPEEMASAEEDMAINWLLLGHVFPRFSQPLIEEYIRLEGHRLSREDLEEAESVRDSRFSLFEVQSVNVGVGLELRDVFMGGESFSCRDVSLSSKLVKYDCLLLRVRERNGDYIPMMSASTVQRHVMPRLRNWVVEDREKSGLDWPEYLRANSHLLRQKSLQLHQDWIDNLVITNTDEEPVILSRAEFEIRDQTALEEVLEGFESYHRIEEPEGAEAGYYWLGPEDPDTGESKRWGDVFVSGRTMTLMCNSRERLGRGVGALLLFAGDAIAERGREYKEFERPNVLEKAPPLKDRDSRVSKELEHKLIAEAKARHYSDWEDTALPALDGYTPREASRKPEFRERLKGLLDMLENRELRTRKEGRPWFDFSDIRKRLKI